MSMLPCRKPLRLNIIQVKIMQHGSADQGFHIYGYSQALDNPDAL